MQVTTHYAPGLVKRSTMRSLPKQYKSELLSLGEIEEVARLDDLIRAIKRKWPPGYYVAMREKDINNARASHRTSKVREYPNGPKVLQPLN
jgi:hypothetical protein